MGNLFIGNLVLINYLFNIKYQELASHNHNR